MVETIEAIKVSNKPLAKLERTPLYQLVQDAIKAYISDNAIQPGDPLPPETELARQLGVSRNSVREAVKALESMGILESRRGSGLFVRAFSFEPLLANLPYGLMGSIRDIEELFEIRRILELAKIEDVIGRVTGDQILAFDAVLEGMHAKAMRGEPFPEEDRDFHRLLVRNLDNHMLNKLIDVFWLALRNAAQSLGMTDPDPLLNYRNHEAIVQALRSRSVHEARTSLDAHYDGIRSRLAQVERRE